MSVITFVILQWDGKENWLESFNEKLTEFDSERKQTLEVLTNFDTNHVMEYGLPGAGGSKWYTLNVAAAALNHVPATKLKEILYKTFDYDKVSEAYLLAIQEGVEPLFVRVGRHD